MRFSSTTVLTAVLAAVTVSAVPLSLDALNREVASLVPALRSSNPASRIPTAATLVGVLEQATTDIANDAQVASEAAISVVSEMSDAVHAALGGHAEPSIDLALARLMQVTSVRGHPVDGTPVLQQLVLASAV